MEVRLGPRTPGLSIARIRGRAVKRLDALALPVHIGLMYKRLMQASMLSLVGFLGAVSPALATQQNVDVSALVSAARNGGQREALAAAEAIETASIGSADLQRAAHWYRQAADRGSGAAWLRLGLMSEDGSGLPQSFADARSEYQKAVALGCEPANLRLGFLYLEGWGVEKDPAKAAQLIQRAADWGYVPAERILSDMYAAGIAVARNQATALKYAEKAAASDDAKAEELIGDLVMARAVKLADRDLARTWLRLSSDKADDRAELHLALSYLSPKTSPAERAIGSKLLLADADAGNPDAQLAVAFFRAMGGSLGPAAEQQSRKYLEEAARSNQPDAVEVLDLVNEGLSPRDAFRRVMTEPYETRYIQKYGTGIRPDANGSMRPYPILIRRPIYPMALRLTRVEGEVLVGFVVDVKGMVRDPRILSATHPGFAKSALATIGSWRFVPGRKNGRVVNTRMRVPIKYQLTNFNISK